MSDDNTPKPRMVNSEEVSRLRWQFAAKDNGWPTESFQVLLLGCLQRIAYALERQADVPQHTPDQRTPQEIVESKNLNEWIYHDGQTGKIAKKTARDLFAATTETALEREAIGRVAEAARSVSGVWEGYSAEAWRAKGPTPEELSTVYAWARDRARVLAAIRAYLDSRSPFRYAAERRAAAVLARHDATPAPAAPSPAPTVPQ